MATKTKKKKFSFPEKVYVYVDPSDGYITVTKDVQQFGFVDGDLWGEYELVRKVKAQSNFSLEEA